MIPAEQAEQALLETLEIPSYEGRQLLAQWVDKDEFSVEDSEP